MRHPQDQPLVARAARHPQHVQPLREVRLCGQDKSARQIPRNEKIDWVLVPRFINRLVDCPPVTGADQASRRRSKIAAQAWTDHVDALVCSRARSFVQQAADVDGKKKDRLDDLSA